VARREKLDSLGEAGERLLRRYWAGRVERVLPSCLSMVAWSVARCSRSSSEHVGDCIACQAEQLIELMDGFVVSSLVICVLFQDSRNSKTSKLQGFIASVPAAKCPEGSARKVTPRKFQNFDCGIRNS
jgi:hypothetical protein